MSTTVDAALLNDAREVSHLPDSVLIDAALSAYLERHRAAEINAAYAAAYDAHPLDEPDEWGDLASWRAAAGRS